MKRTCRWNYIKASGTKKNTNLGSMLGLSGMRVPCELTDNQFINIVIFS